MKTQNGRSMGRAQNVDDANLAARLGVQHPKGDALAATDPGAAPPLPAQLEPGDAPQAPPLTSLPLEDLLTLRASAAAKEVIGLRVELAQARLENAQLAARIVESAKQQKEAEIEKRLGLDGANVDLQTGAITRKRAAGGAT